MDADGGFICKSRAAVYSASVVLCRSSVLHIMLYHVISYHTGRQAGRQAI